MRHLKPIITCSIILSLLLVIAACDLPVSYSSEVLTGLANGEPWTFASGSIDRNGYVKMYAEEVIFGDVFTALPSDVIFFTINPLEEGEVRLQLDPSGLNTSKAVTMYIDGVNHICTRGGYEVLIITDTEISGRMRAEADNENFINGTFTLTRIQ